jgi:hypothetical protein
MTVPVISRAQQAVQRMANRDSSQSPVTTDAPVLSRAQAALQKRVKQNGE